RDCLRCWCWHGVRDYGQRDLIFSDSDDGKIGNLFFFGGDSGERGRERKRTVVVIGSHGILSGWIGHSCEGKLRLPPRKFSVAQARMQRDLVARVLRNVYAVMNSVSGSGRDEPHIDD